MVIVGIFAIVIVGIHRDDNRQTVRPLRAVNEVLCARPKGLNPMLYR
jgi:hypothetical protein